MVKKKVLVINPREYSDIAKKGPGEFPKYLTKMFIDKGIVPGVNAKISVGVKTGNIIVRWLEEDKSMIIKPGDE